MMLTRISLCCADFRQNFDKMKKQTKPEDPLYKVLAQEGIDELVFLILLNEVLKRRHKKDMGFLQF